MIDFSKLKSLILPEGKVTQITDASGRVLWKSGPPMVRVTVGARVDDGSPKATVTINGEKFNLNVATSYIDTTPVWEGELPVGAELLFHNGTAASAPVDITHADGAHTSGSVGVIVPYTYIVIGPTSIVVEGVRREVGPSMYDNGVPKFYIYEIPEGQIMFTIRGENYFADEGMTWGEWVNSEYAPVKDFLNNVYVYQIDGDMIRHTEQAAYVCLPDYVTFVRSTTPIVANTAYVLQKD